jgi:hypothetical protein
LEIPILFWTLTLVCCAHAAIVGGAAGRWGAALFVITAASSYLAEYVLGRPPDVWGRANTILAIVDGTYLVGLYLLAQISRCYWPIWAAGFQLNSTLTHVAVLLSPTEPRLYRALESVWAIPILLAMMIGIEADRRSGI